MNVLIEGMEMPISCCACLLKMNCDDCEGWECFCLPLQTKIGYYGDLLADKRRDDCPLVPVPPHGRLINADALIADLKRQCKEVFRIDAVSPDDFWITRDHAYNERLWKTWCESFFEYLKERDTVIPASEEGET